MATKPRVIVLGGCGFIGRNLVQYLSDNGLVSKIRVADKLLPDLAGLSAKQTEIYKSDLVDFKQANLARETMVSKVFDTADGKWDFVFNLAGETKYSQTEEVYKENIIDVSVTCGNAAAKAGVQRFIEISTSQVYDADKKASDEKSKTKPWTKLAKAKLEAEEKLRAINGLKLIVVRPAIVYGPGDVTGVTPRVITAAVYKQLGETMDYLWDKDLRLNTVHVADVAAGLWHLTQKGTLGEVYNLADQNDTDQGSINKLLEPLFGIKTSFKGYLASKAATSIAMKSVAEFANEKHLKPWSDLCKSKGIVNTPLTPYLDEELLYNNPLSVDGNKITTTGFSYKHPKMTEADIKESINYFIALKFFPTGVI
jgi:nucleoside-diphosphate-sugar epimerase